MDIKSVSLPVLNAVFFIRDSNSNDVPEISRDATIWSTTDCIAVGCMPDCDGETKITLGSPGKINLAKKPVFDGTLQTPSGLIRVDIVPKDGILEQRVPGTSTRVRIWVNDPARSDPDDITIGLN